MSATSEATECCPKFNPEPWDDKTISWEGKRFVKERVRTFFFIPLTFGIVMRRLMNVLNSAGATIPDALCLSDHTSRWDMDLYVSVDKEVPGLANITLSGRFYSRVYEGDFRDTAQWCADFKTRAKDHGWEVAKWYMWYTTCPKCAKKFGKNYVVILGQV
jgi:hypothetical protein